MAKAKDTGRKTIEWDPGEANPKQALFYQSRTLFTAYGGAKGGGKTHAVRVKAVGGALTYPGIKILIMRQKYKELEENHIRPIINMVPPELASYNGSTHIMTFENGSTINFGHWQGRQSESEYNGLEYDWIFIDEATQFTERTFNFLGGCLRGVNNIPKRMYLTCNPGGVGHRWVKRLFIDRNFKTGCENPEENENPDDYTFIPATVEDNYHLMQSSPLYARMLANMPEELRRAYRYGDWNAIGGNYFPEFTPGTHTRKPFAIPGHWTLYRTFDYGLDMFACYWIAVDEDGRSWVFREYRRKDLIAQEAADKILANTLPGEKIMLTFAPPDIWNRNRDTGRSTAEVMMMKGINLVQSSSNRVQGHLMIKSLLANIPLKDPYVKSLYGPNPPTHLPGLMFFDTCKDVISDMQDIQADEEKPDDCAAEPHDVTHSVDAIRYYSISRTTAAEQTAEKQPVEEQGGLVDYDEYMCGGEPTEDYLMYA